MKIRYIITACLVLLVSCSTTKINYRWKAKDITPQSSYREIMAVVVAGDEDRPLVEKMENHIAGDFTAMGYIGMSALREFGPKALWGLNEAALMAKMNEKEVDAVMMVSLLNKSREKYYVPARMQQTPYAVYYDRFHRHYDIIYDRTITPGYYAEDTRYFWECSFYDAHTGKLLYSAISESFDPQSVDGLAHRYALMMINDMISQNIIVDLVAERNFEK